MERPWSPQRKLEEARVLLHLASEETDLKTRNRWLRVADQLIVEVLNGCTIRQNH